VPKGSVTMDRGRCKLCGICIAVCPVDNLAIVEGALAAADRCTGCGLCELHCPDFAIVATREGAATKPSAKKGA